MDTEEAVAVMQDKTRSDSASGPTGSSPHVKVATRKKDPARHIIRRHAVTRYAMTDERKARYLAALSKHGSHKAAAMEATPIDPTKKDQIQRGHGYSSFLQLRQRDPAFAAACEEALSTAMGKLERDLAVRARTPDTAPVVNKDGDIVGQRVSWDAANRLALRILTKNDPEWIEQRKVGVEGNITISPAGNKPMLGATTEDLKLLTREEQELFFQLIDKIAEERKRRENDPLALPAPPELQDIVDGEIVEQEPQAVELEEIEDLPEPIEVCAGSAGQADSGTDGEGSDAASDDFPPGVTDIGLDTRSAGPPSLEDAAETELPDPGDPSQAPLP